MRNQKGSRTFSRR